MLQILRAVKKIIEKFIVNMVPLRAVATAGEYSVQVESTRRFCISDVVVVYHKENDYSQSEGEVHVITEMPDKYTLTLDTPLVGSYGITNSFVEKMIGFTDGSETFLDSVYIGDPEVIMRYPAITIAPGTRNSEWMTLESIKDDFTIDITVYVLGADYEVQQELMLMYAKAIENALFRSLYPLTEPYDQTLLLENVEPQDTTIKVEDENFFQCGRGWVFLESADFLRSNQLREDLGSGSYKLSLPAGVNFSVGDKLIRPKRHIFNTLPASTRYGSSTKGAFLRSAKISYKASEERRIYVPYVDALTF